MLRRTPLSVEVKKVLKMLMFTLCALLIATSGYFFVKMSNTAEDGYKLKENQLRHDNLESENRILEQQVLDAQSMKNLQTSNVIEGMAPPTNPVFMQPQGPLTKGNRLGSKVIF